MARGGGTMAAMHTLTRWGHACIRFDGPGGSLAVDPGVYSDLDRALAGVGGVLVTHTHEDHLDAARVAAAALPVWAPPAVVAALAAAGAPDELLTPVADGDELDVAGFHVRVLGELHAVIHPDLPPLANVSYLVDGVVLHPGDARPPLPAGSVQVLLVPTSGGWVHLDATVDWVRALAPGLAVPIHDAMLSAPGQATANGLLTHLAGVPVRTLAPGEPLAVGA